MSSLVPLGFLIEIWIKTVILTNHRTDEEPWQAVLRALRGEYAHQVTTLSEIKLILLFLLVFFKFTLNRFKYVLK